MKVINIATAFRKNNKDPEFLKATKLSLNEIKLNNQSKLISLIKKIGNNSEKIAEAWPEVTKDEIKLLMT